MMRSLLILLLLNLFIVPLYPEDVKPLWSDMKSLKVAMIDMVSRISKEEIDVTTLSEMLASSFVDNNEFIMVERNLIEKVIKEQKFQLSGITEDQAAKIGVLTGAKKIITGSLSKMGDKYVIVLKGLDTSTGVNEVSDTVMATTIDGLLDLMPVLAERFIKKAKGQKIPVFKTSSDSYASLDKWEILDGNWYEKDNAIYGRGGLIIFKETMVDYIFELTIEGIEGESWPAIAVGSRFNVVPGGAKNYRNNTSEVPGIWFNFTLNKTYNLFYGAASGNTYLIYPNFTSWQSTEFIQDKINKIRIEVNQDNYKIFVNNHMLASFNNKLYMKGSPLLAIQEKTQVIKFSDIKITIK